MFMLSPKQVESNYNKNEPCEQDCSWIIKFSYCLNSGYCKYGIIIFSTQTQNGRTRSTHEEKNVWSVHLLPLFNKSWFKLDVFSRRVSFPFEWGKATFPRSRRRHGDTNFSKLVNLCPVKKFPLTSTPVWLPPTLAHLF